MITIELDSPAPPSAVLAAMRAHAGEWRESKIPAELRSAGISALEGWIDDMTFILIYAPSQMGGITWPAYLRARATVSRAGGGSRVRVAVDYRMQDVIMPMMGAGFVSLMGVVAFGPRALWLLLWPGTVWGVAYLQTRRATRKVSRSENPAADYLVRRIEKAVAGARIGTGPSPAS